MTPSPKKQTVGAEIETHCTKCKIDRIHVIETLKADGSIHRVICRTCDASHAIRRTARPKSASAPTTKRRRKGAVKLTDADLAKAKPYSMDGVFVVGDVIQHAKFGPGSVLEVKSDGKMEVGFESGGKTLICRSPYSSGS